MIQRIRTAQVAFLVVAIGCVPAPAVAPTPAPRVSLGVDTLVLAVHAASGSSADQALRAAISEAVASRIADAVVVTTPTFDEYDAPIGRLSARLTIDAHQTAFSGGTWSARVALSLLAIDHRSAEPTIVEEVTTQDASRFNMWGYRSRDEAAAEAQTRAIEAVVRELSLVASRNHPRAERLVVSSSPSDYRMFGTAGLANLTGQAFLTTRGGDVKLAAGRMVTLDPLTPLTQHWFRRIGSKVGSFSAVPRDSLFVAARRTTTADAEGRFSFRGVPSGRYLLRSVVTWEVPTGAGLSREGGVVAMLVDLAPSNPNEIVLSSTELTLPPLSP